MKDGSFWSALASRRVDPSRLRLEHLSLLPRQHMGWWGREGGGNMTLAKKNSNRLQLSLAILQLC